MPTAFSSTINQAIKELKKLSDQELTKRDVSYTPFLALEEDGYETL
jgi:hypothetical protein